MSEEKITGYQPDDPRYGLTPEELKQYYRDKPQQWAIVAWDKPGQAATRAANIDAQKVYAEALGERLIGYGHIVADADEREVRATAWFVQLDGRESAEAFAAADPLARAGVYAETDIRRWSNSFLRRQADYARKGEQQFLYFGWKIPDAAPFIAQHLKDHEDYFKAHEDRFIFRGPLRSPDGTENVGSALMIELPDRAAAETFWANEPFAANGGYRDDFRIYRWVFGDTWDSKGGTSP